MKSSATRIAWRVASVVTIFALIHEIDNSTRRISELVAAIKRYSYMDQAAMQEVNLRDDLENTLQNIWPLAEKRYHRYSRI